MASSGIKKRKERYNWRPVETRRIEDKSALEDCSFVLNQAKQKSGGFNRIQYLKSPIFIFILFRKRTKPRTNWVRKEDTDLQTEIAKETSMLQGQTQGSFYAISFPSLTWLEELKTLIRKTIL